jgi:ribonuclease P protein component
MLWIPASRTTRFPRKASSRPVSAHLITLLEHQTSSLLFTGSARGSGGPAGDSSVSVVADLASRPYGDGLTSSVPLFRNCHSRGVDSCPRCSEDQNEAAVSAQRAQTGQETWVSLAHEHPRRTRRGPVSPPKGARSAVRVISRLSGREDFARLRAEGTRSRNGPIRLVSRANGTDTTRIAFAIPQRVGNAVQRNRTRRRIRAVLHELERDNPESMPSGDHLIRVTAPIDDWSHAKLRHTMSVLFTPAAISAAAPSEGS